VAKRDCACGCNRAGARAGVCASGSLVAEVKYLTWTGDNLLRQVVYEGLREDKPAAEVRREVPKPKP
jgi:bifunctional non-homologous end joining protein LigD